MKLEVNGSRLTVKRESHAPRIRTESQFWHELKLEMRRREKTQRWVKVREPGALSSMPYGLRLGPMRKINRMVIDSDYAIRCPAQRYNNKQEVELQLIAAESM